MPKDTQMVLPKLTIQVSKEVGGIEMGVLSDGTAFLSGRALAKLCGVGPSSISEAGSDWASGKRSTRLARYLATDGGLDRPALAVVTEIPGVAGNVTYAYPEDVCHLVLEYYAMVVGNEDAKKNFRTLMRAGVRQFVYHALGYTGAAPVPIAWRKFHDRMLTISAPPLFFSVFKEMADFVLASIRAGLTVDEHTIPDISVGQLWGRFWEEKHLANQYGNRIRHDHNYPEYFPQAKSNPQPIWVYPVHALGEFRIWLQSVYIPKAFPKYLDGKVRHGLLPASVVQLIVEQTTAPSLSASDHSPNPSLATKQRNAKT